MDLAGFSLPEWLPWWAVVGALLPVSFYLALFLLMPFSTFGLRAKLRDMEMQIEALHEEIRALTLRLPERGLGRGIPDRVPGGLDDRLDDFADAGPPIPPAPREPRRGQGGGPGGGFGDPVADRMLAYMREKSQSDMNRAGESRAPRPRTEPRFVPPPALGPEADIPPPPPVGVPPGMAAPEPDMPPPPRMPGRFGRRREDDGGEPRPDWQR